MSAEDVKFLTEMFGMRHPSSINVLNAEKLASGDSKMLNGMYSAEISNVFSFSLRPKVCTSSMLHKNAHNKQKATTHIIGTHAHAQPKVSPYELAVDHEL